MDQKNLRDLNETQRKTFFKVTAMQAEKGDVNAEAMLGDFYSEGYGTEKNLELAVQWWTKAAEKGHALSQYNLAISYMQGLGVALDNKIGLKWLTAAEQQNLPEAVFLMGAICHTGRLGEKNRHRCVEYFLKSAEAGYVEAQAALANEYAKGEMVQQDVEKAVFWWTKAAEQGHEQAIRNLKAYEKNPTSIEKGIERERDDSKAFKVVIQRAEAGDAEMQYYAGLVYEKGQGQVQNYTLAKQWYEKSVEGGYGPAAYRLGMMYASGRVTGKEEVALAYPYWVKAAERGIGDAAFNIALLHFNGFVVEKDKTVATKMLDVATALKCENAAGLKQTIDEFDDVTVERVVNDMIEFFVLGRPNAMIESCLKTQDEENENFESENVKSDQAEEIEEDRKDDEAPVEKETKEEPEKKIESKQPEKTDGPEPKFNFKKFEENKKKYEEIFNENLKRAEAGDGQAMADVGWAYYTGLFGKMNDKLAKEWFEKAIEKDCPDGYRGLGVLYYYGDGVEADEAEALQNLTTAYVKGCKRACAPLAKFYKNSSKEKFVKYLTEGMEARCTNAFNDYGSYCEEIKDYERAEKCFNIAIKLDEFSCRSYNLLAALYREVYDRPRKAFETFLEGAEHGSQFSDNKIGECYLNGWGVETDEVKAVNWFKRASDAGNYFGTKNLGKCYYYGYGVSVDYEKAFECFNKSKKSIESQFMLGEYYFEIKKDFKKALEYLKKAADDGHSGAANIVAAMYLEGDGTEKNYEKALEYYKMAAKDGRSDALNSLGIMYEEGYGVQQDLKRAVAFYQQAVLREDSNAQNNLGFLYLEGRGVEKDVEKGFELLVKAADNGIKNSMYEVAREYFMGDTLPKNYEKALEYASKLYEQGDSRGAKLLYAAYIQGFGVDVDKDKAREYMEELALKNDNVAQLQLGKDLLYGQNGLEQNLERGRFWLEKACENGSIEATRIVGQYSYAGRNGFPRDEQKSERLLKKAMENGDVLSKLYYIAIVSTKGTKKSLEQAAKLANELESHIDELRACDNEAEYYYARFSIDLALQNDKKAFEYLKKCADLGHSGALCYMGNLYIGRIINFEFNNGKLYSFKTNPVKVNYNKGFELLKKSEMLGCKSKLLFLGLSSCYENGNGTEKNAKYAAYYKEQAKKSDE